MTTDENLQLQELITSVVDGAFIDWARLEQLAATDEQREFLRNARPCHHPRSRPGSCVYDFGSRAFCGDGSALRERVSGSNEPAVVVE